MKRFLAVYIGSPPSNETPPSRPDTEVIARGMAEWGQWMARNAASIVETGGPLGPTMKASANGIEKIRNSLTGYVIVEAETHEAAARLFENHPHFTIFPGKSVEIMECLPIPGAP